MSNLKSWYWWIISLFSGAVAFGAAYHMGVEPQEAHHALTTTVEYAENAWTLHGDNGLMVAEGAAAGGTAKTMRKIQEKITELKGNVEQVLEKESEIKDAKDAAHDAKNKVNKISEKNAELIDEIKELRDDTIKEMQDHLDELDVKIQEGGSRSPGKSMGQKVADGLMDSVEQKDFTGSRPPAGVSFQTRLENTGVKDITNLGSSAGDVVEPDFREEIIPSPVLRTPQVLDLVTINETSSDSVEWVKQSSETDNASPQSSQGSALSKTDMEFTLNTQSVETMGHIAKASVQILNDAPRLRDFVNTRMRALLELELEDQVLKGSGTGANLSGLIPNAVSYNSNLENSVVDGTPDDIDRIGTMILQVQRNNFPVTGILLSPLNWWGITLEKDADGRYRFANAQAMTAPRLWGFPVVSSNAMPEGEALVGNFQLGATFFDRRDTTIEASTENADDFEKLMVTIRAYLRGTLAVQQPDAMVHNASMDATAPSAGS